MGVRFDAKDSFIHGVFDKKGNLSINLDIDPDTYTGAFLDMGTSLDSNCPCMVVDYAGILCVGEQHEELDLLDGRGIEIGPKEIKIGYFRQGGDAAGPRIEIYRDGRFHKDGVFQVGLKE